MISEEIPEATLCSASESRPLPPSRSNPTAEARSHWPRVGAGSPASRRHTYRMAPATR